ncbi:MAG: nucleoside 2-deoxyribosyltransferase [Bacteroidota bacterium]
MLTAYVSVSFKQKDKLTRELDVIAHVLKDFNLAPFVFVNNYLFTSQEEQRMMQQAMDDIDKCDLFIAETSEKAIGIGVEAGYAKAKGKPVIYLRNHKAEHSTTVAGISNFQIIYDDVNDLERQLQAAIAQIFR